MSRQPLHGKSNLCEPGCVTAVGGIIKAIRFRRFVAPPAISGADPELAAKTDAAVSVALKESLLAEKTKFQPDLNRVGANHPREEQCANRASEEIETDVAMELLQTWLHSTQDDGFDDATSADFGSDAYSSAAKKLEELLNAEIARLEDGQLDEQLHSLVKLPKFDGLLTSFKRAPQQNSSKMQGQSWPDVQWDPASSAVPSDPAPVVPRPAVVPTKFGPSGQQLSPAVLARVPTPISSRKRVISSFGGCVAPIPEIERGTVIGSPDRVAVSPADRHRSTPLEKPWGMASQTPIMPLERDGALIANEHDKEVPTERPFDSHSLPEGGGAVLTGEIRRTLVSHGVESLPPVAGFTGRGPFWTCGSAPQKKRSSVRLSSRGTATNEFHGWEQVGSAIRSFANLVGDAVSGASDTAPHEDELTTVILHTKEQRVQWKEFLTEAVSKSKASEMFAAQDVGAEPPSYMRPPPSCPSSSSRADLNAHPHVIAPCGAGWSPLVGLAQYRLSPARSMTSSSVETDSWWLGGCGPQLPRTTSGCDPEGSEAKQILAASVATQPCKSLTDNFIARTPNKQPTSTFFLEASAPHEAKSLCATALPWQQGQRDDLPGRAASPPPAG